MYSKDQQALGEKLKMSCIRIQLTIFTNFSHSIYSNKRGDP